MKKASKEINIFSMSALDMFASALGVFILIAVVLFPFFPYTGTFEQLMEEQAKSAELQERLEELQRQLDACQANLEQTQEDLQECSRIAKRTFVLAVMSWGSGDDIDLHVIDPSGRRYSYLNRRYSGSPAELEVDNTRGPGNEIWLHPSASAGKYTVAYHFYNYTGSDRSRVSTRGLILTQEAKEELPIIELTKTRPMQIVAEVHVDDEGNIRVDRSRSGATLEF